MRLRGCWYRGEWLDLWIGWPRKGIELRMIVGRLSHDVDRISLTGRMRNRAKNL